MVAVTRSLATRVSFSVRICGIIIENPAFESILVDKQSKENGLFDPDSPWVSLGKSAETSTQVSLLPVNRNETSPFDLIVHGTDCEEDEVPWNLSSITSSAIVIASSHCGKIAWIPM